MDELRDLKEWETICPVCLGDCRMSKHFTFSFVNRCLNCNGTGIITKKLDIPEVHHDDPYEVHKQIKG